MKYDKLIALFFCLTIFFTFFSGIIRDDVDEAAYLELANEPQFDCVGQVFHDTTVTGSCVLINSQFALTAAHVLLTNDTRQDTVKMNGQVYITHIPVNVRVANASNIYFQINGRKVRAKKLILHPEYLKNLEKGDCDIALIELEEPIQSIVPAHMYTLADELSSNVVGVGFGASGKANRPDSIVVIGKKIAGENVVDKISGAKYDGKETILSCDFDAASLKGCNKMGSPTPRPLEYICAGGDSGGGLFKQSGEDWFLVGICSGGGTNLDQLMKTGYYGQVMDWMRVSVFDGWIDSMMAN